MQSHVFTGPDQPWKAPAALEPLAAQSHWMLWRLVERKGKKTKVPYQADGRLAKPNDPGTWGDLDSMARVAHLYNGVGFALLNSGIAAFDIDDCIADGVVSPWARALVEATDSYAEVTPSGTGLRILGYGNGPKVHRKLAVPDTSVSCELYRQAERYITVSGNVYHDRPLANIDAHIDRVLAELDQPKQKERPAGAPTTGHRTLPQGLKLMLHASGDNPAGYTSRSELLWAFLGAALRAGLDENEIVALCQHEVYAGNSIYEHVQANGGADYLLNQIEKAANDAGTVDNANRQIVKITSSNLHEAWRATERALIRAKCPVFVRAGALVQPLWRLEKSSEPNRKTLITAFTKLNLPRLRDIIAHHAVSFTKYDAHQRKDKPINPPKDVVETLLEAGHWGFASVRGIVNSPTMRPDGSLLTEPGHDAATELWYKPAGDIELPPIPDKPTKDDAKAALELFNHLLSEFPFVDKDKGRDKAVAVAAILTVVLRGAFEFAPMFFVRAPEAGTGKTYLVKLISTIATGRDAASMSGSKNPEEMEKRLSAAAFEAPPILNLNNLAFDLESAFLCTMITEGIVGIRPFGKNTETIPCDCRATTVFANGNNVRLVGDLVRRALTIQIDAQTEEPEKRIFKLDPLSLVKKDRGKYLAAAFTIARAYMADGSPKQEEAAPIAGFGGWSRFVQLPLVWLGQADPVSSMEDARAMDPERAALSERIGALVKAFGFGVEFSAADVNAKALDTTMDGQRVVYRYPLMEAYSRDGKSVSAKAIGNKIMNDLNRVSDGCKIVLTKTDPKRANRYRLVQVGNARPKEEPF